MMTQDGLLKSINDARALTRSYLTPRWASWHAQLRTMIELLDGVERRVRSSWPPLTSDAYADVRIGLYAIRNLEEIDNGQLSLPLCRLDNALKNR
jgi:hypothetical protein